MATSKFTLNVTECTLGSTKIKVDITRDKDTYTHTIKVYCGNLNTEVATNVATSYSFTPSIDWCKYITKATSATATIKVKTYRSDGTKVGELSKTIKFKVPKSIVPTVSISVTPNNQVNGYNIENKTTFTVKPTNASGIYGSTIKSYKITGGGLDSSSSSSVTTNKLSAGSYTFVVKVTDSRGRTGSASLKVDVYGNYKPIIKLTAYRCMSNGTANDSGTYMNINFSWDITPLASNATKTYKIQHRSVNVSSFTTDIKETNLDNIKGSKNIILSNVNGSFDLMKSYYIKLTINDGTNESYSTKLVSAIKTVFNIEKDGVGIGKIHESGALDVGGSSYFSGDLVLRGQTGAAGTSSTIGLFATRENERNRLVAQSYDGTVFLGTNIHYSHICSLGNPSWYNLEDDSFYNIWTNKGCTVTSDSYGHTYRFQNGLQISVISYTVSLSYYEVWGKVYRSHTTIDSQNFTQSFLNTPVVIPTVYTDESKKCMIYQDSKPTTSSTGTFRLWCPESKSSKATESIKIFAIGRWK